MSILEKYSAALKNKDEAAMNELLHDDFKFTMHKSGNVLTKGDVIKWAMSGDINQDKVRIVYENDEVGIHHAFVTFNDGNVEAVMATILFPSIITAITIVLCMYTLSLVMKNIPMGITYASFAGLTIIATVIVGVIKYNQVPNLYSMIGLAFIIIGVLMVNLLGSK